MSVYENASHLEGFQTFFNLFRADRLGDILP